MALCAPRGIRTPNNGSEDRRDIHFTMGALIAQDHYTQIRAFYKEALIFNVKITLQISVKKIIIKISFI